MKAKHLFEGASYRDSSVASTPSPSGGGVFVFTQTPKNKPKHQMVGAKMSSRGRGKLFLAGVLSITWRLRLFS